MVLRGCPGPQGLKPAFLSALGGTAEAVPYPKPFMRPVLLFALEAITTASVLGKLLRHFQKRSSGVRQPGFLPVHQAQLALKMQIAHRNAHQLATADLAF